MNTIIENTIATDVLDVCFAMHRELGPGLFESVYEEVLFTELTEAGIDVQRQVDIPIIWRGRQMEKSFRADLIVSDSIIVEIKAVENILNVHKKQLYTYLKLTDYRLGLLINFNEALLKNGITRVANNLN